MPLPSAGSHHPAPSPGPNLLTFLKAVALFWSGQKKEEDTKISGQMKTAHWFIIPHELRSRMLDALIWRRIRRILPIDNSLSKVSTQWQLSILQLKSVP